MEKKKLIIIGLSVFFILQIGITIWAKDVPMASPKPGKVHELVFMSVYPAVHQQYRHYGMLLDRLEEASKGRIKFKRYPASQLVAAREALEACGKGVFDVLSSYPAYYSGKCAVGDMGFPGGWRNQVSYDYYILNDPSIIDLLSRAYSKVFNVVVVGPGPHVPYNLLIMAPGKDIRKFEDFKGKKVRSPGGSLSEATKKLGLAPVTLIAEEWYIGLKTGTVDGVLGYIYTLSTYKLGEVAGSITNYPIVPQIPLMTWVNKDTWEKLPKDLKEIWNKTTEEWVWKQMVPLMKEEEDKDWEYAKRHGIEITELPKSDRAKADALVTPVGQEFYLKQCEAQGFGAEGKILIDKMKKSWEEWPKLEKKLLMDGLIKEGKYQIVP